MRLRILTLLAVMAFALAPAFAQEPPGTQNPSTFTLDEAYLQAESPAVVVLESRENHPEAVQARRGKHSLCTLYVDGALDDTAVLQHYNDRSMAIEPVCNVTFYRQQDCTVLTFPRMETSYSIDSPPLAAAVYDADNKVVTQPYYTGSTLKWRIPPG